MKVFVDTWAWVALVDKHDAYHDFAAKTYREQVLKETAFLVTSDYVLSESLTTLRPIVGHEKAIRWFSQMLEESENKILHLVMIDAQLLHKSFALLQRYADKPVSLLWILLLLS